MPSHTQRSHRIVVIAFVAERIHFQFHSVFFLYFIHEQNGTVTKFDSSRKQIVVVFVQ